MKTGIGLDWAKKTLSNGYQKDDPDYGTTTMKHFSKGKWNTVVHKIGDNGGLKKYKDHNRFRGK
jgi:hypothetical protein